MNASIPQISVEQLRSDLAAGVPLIDVREDDEYLEGHVPGAIPRPLSTLPEHLDGLPTGVDVDIICRSGARSQRASEFLVGRGLKPRNVTGGTQAWVDAGYPVETGPSGA